MPSTSAAVRPASRMALRTAQVASARVVLPEPRVYVVSPTPAIAYLSRRYFGVLVSASLLGNGISRPPDGSPTPAWHDCEKDSPRSHGGHGGSTLHFTL